MTSVAEIFSSMDYGPAPESDGPARQWLARHDGKFGLHIDGRWHEPDTGRHFDLIIADPPYGEKNVGRRSTSLAQRLLDDPVLPGLLAPGGRFVIGHTKRDTLEIPAPWKELKELRHGDTVMRFLARPDAERPPGGAPTP